MMGGRECKGLAKAGPFVLYSRCMKDIPPAQKFLTVYSGALTLVLAVIALSAARAPKKASFDELTVQRINVVEPDGTLRLVIANRARWPGSYVKGVEKPRDRSGTGLMFLDGEGTEMGALAWDGGSDKGKGGSNGHLSFDRYQGDQMFVVNSGGSGDETQTTLGINDSFTGIEKVLDEDQRIEKLPKDQQEAAYAKLNREFPFTHRIELRRDTDKSAQILMKDTEGRNRIVLKVSPAGDPSIELLDEKGKAVGRLPAVTR